MNQLILWIFNLGFLLTIVSAKSGFRKSMDAINIWRSAELNTADDESIKLSPEDLEFAKDMLGISDTDTGSKRRQGLVDWSNQRGWANDDYEDNDDQSDYQNYDYRDKEKDDWLENYDEDWIENGRNRGGPDGNRFDGRTELGRNGGLSAYGYGKRPVYPPDECLGETFKIRKNPPAKFTYAKVCLWYHIDLHFPIYDDEVQDAVLAFDAAVKPRGTKTVAHMCVFGDSFLTGEDSKCWGKLCQPTLNEKWPSPLGTEKICSKLHTKIAMTGKFCSNPLRNVGMVRRYFTNKTWHIGAHVTNSARTIEFGCINFYKKRITYHTD